MSTLEIAHSQACVRVRPPTHKPVSEPAFPTSAIVWMLTFVCDACNCACHEARSPARRDRPRTHIGACPRLKSPTHQPVRVVHLTDPVAVAVRMTAMHSHSQARLPAHLPALPRHPAFPHYTHHIYSHLLIFSTIHTTLVCTLRFCPILCFLPTHHACLRPPALPNSMVFAYAPRLFAPASFVTLSDFA